MEAVQKVTLEAPVKAASRSMRAVVQREYGEAEVLGVEEVARPVPGEDQVLVRVHAATVSVGDHHVVTGKPYLIRLTPFGGLPRPKNAVPGQALAGTVEAVGAKVTQFRVGDAVFGQAATGAWAQYVVMPAALLATKPGNLSFEEAAAVPWGATALVALCDVKPGQRVLVNGASGGVGTWAVQIAKAKGAHVTAVCSTRNVELVRGLGADEVLDYTRQDFLQGPARFDVFLDLVGNRPLAQCKKALTPSGTFVPCSGGGGDWVGPMLRIVGGLLLFMFGGQKFKTFVMAPNLENLVSLKALVESGQAKPVIEHCFPLARTGEALRHIGTGHSRGQTVLRLVD